VTTDVLALVNGEFQRVTPETSVSGKGHAQNEKVSAHQTRGASAEGQAMPGLLHLRRLKKIRKSHRAFA
jgi:hypothetical protein